MVALWIDITWIFSTIKEDRIFSRLLVPALNNLADRRWTELSKGKPITEMWLVHQCEYIPFSHPPGVGSRRPDEGSLSEQNQSRNYYFCGLTRAT